MVNLSPTTEAHDALDVLAAQRKELILDIETPRPLRKPKTARHAIEMRALRGSVRAQIRNQMRSQRRRAFRGRIAVELRMSIPEGRHNAGIGPVVKAYLDELEGAVVADDARIDHLLIAREPAETAETHVRVKCVPITVFCSDFDRAFRVLDASQALAAARRSTYSKAATPEHRAHNGLPRPQRVWGLRHFGQHDREQLRYEEGILDLIEELDAQEEDQLSEDPDGFVDLDVSSTYEEFRDADTRASTRRYLRESTAFGRGDWLTDNGFHAHDRPGLRPKWLLETVALDVADVVQLRDDGPGCYVLPPPPEQTRSPGSRKWSDEIAREFAVQRAQDRWYRARFRGAVALDIAVRGDAAPTTDLDNLAAKVLRAFNRTFAQSTPELAAYRVYRLAADSRDVRVRLLPAVRLDGLATAMEEARRVVRRERPWRIRD